MEASSIAGLRERLAELVAWCRSEGHSPILHIESHGTPQGLEVGSESISWAELKPYFTDVNLNSKLNLFVCLAACSGAHMIQVVTPIERAPVWGIVGPRELIGELEMAEDFRRFYETLIEERDGSLALSRLFGERGVGGPYQFIPAEEFFMEVWKNYRGEQNTPARIATRARAIATDLQAKGVDATSPLAVVEERVTRMLNDEALQGRLFKDNYWSPFFMVDLYADNARRFPMSYRDVCPV